MQHKFTSYTLWVVIAIALGILISYGTLKSDEIAYGKMWETAKEFIYEQKEQPKQIIQKIKDIPDNKDEERVKDTLRIGFVGDIMPGIGAARYIFSDATAYTKVPDIMIGNFEGAVLSENYFKCKESDTRCYAFNSDTDFLGLLAAASFDILSIANNHFNDSGPDGQMKTLEEIKNAGMTPVGIKNEITYVSKNDLRIGFVGFSAYKWTTDINSAKRVESMVREAKENSDIVIVLFHGGAEGVAHAHVPNETEWYLGENRGDLRNFGRQAIDAGADLILGSGPHVLRGMEWYNGKLIAYSLGNFASANRVLNTGLLKTSALLDITLKKDGTFVSGQVVPFEIDSYGIPHLDIQSTGITVINELSQTDFGDQGVLLGTDGKILK